MAGIVASMSRCPIKVNFDAKSARTPAAVQKAGFESQISPFSTLNATRKFSDQAGAEGSSDL
jgi:hypothetical protein